MLELDPKHVGATTNYQITSSITNQAATNANTLQFTGAAENDLTLAGALNLSGGILRSGGGNTVISGGSIAFGSVTEGMVIRTDTAPPASSAPQAVPA